MPKRFLRSLFLARMLLASLALTSLAVAQEPRVDSNETVHDATAAPTAENLDTIQEIIDKNNQNLPNTRLPSSLDRKASEVVVNMIYNKAIISTLLQQTNSTLDDFFKTIDDIQKQSTCANPESILLFGNKLALRFNYYDVDKKTLLHTRVISAKTCGIIPDSIQLLKK